MNPEQQRIAIAEACGWTVKEDKDGFWRAVDRLGNMTHELWISESNVLSAGIPDYLNDLNAMHEAEASLFGRNDWSAAKYETLLMRMASSWAWHATAAQRAEAFLRTICKWKEVK